MSVLWLAIGFFLNVSSTHAQQLSDQELYERCYQRLVKAPTPVSDPVLLSVKNGSLSGSAACMTIYDKARFAANGVLVDQSPAAKAVLKTFHDFHRSWFQAHTNDGVAGQGFLSHGLIGDLEEPALFITKSAFQPDTQYRSVVTSAQSIRGVRVRPAPALSPYLAQKLVVPNSTSLPLLAPKTQLQIAYNTDTTPLTVTHVVVPDARLVDTGALIGIENNPVFSIPNMRQIPAANAIGISAAVLQNTRRTVAVNQNFGGGIIGSPTYLMVNSNLVLDIVAEGDEVINRRVAARAFEDLLCHDLPTLRPGDVSLLVDLNSPLTFKRSVSCMTCHAQIDPFAHTYRNLVLGLSANQASINGHQEGFPVYAFQKLPGSGTTGPWALRAPTGVLRFRNYQSANVTTVNVSSIAQLGAGLAGSSDLYLCATKRYFKFFTGIDVPLSPLTQLPPGSNNEAKIKFDLDQAHQNFVFEVSNRFRTHQSIRTLIKEIVESQAFRDRGYISSREVNP